MGQSDIFDLLTSLKDKYDYDFTDYAEASITRRIQLFMNSYKIKSIADLRSSLLCDEELFELFIQNASVTVTEMFRDPAFYKALREKVLPRLSTYPIIKIWLAGCATGEEAYSTAILLKEEGLYKRSIIYATDINQQSIRVAQEGIYNIDKMQDYTHNYIKSGGKDSFSKYYKANFNSVIMNKGLKENILFAPHNLTMDKSFNEFQLIICRNVLIYFNQSLQNKIFNLFYESLCPFGFLGLGNKESLLFSDKRRMFEEIDRKEKIFIKTAH